MKTHIKDKWPSHQITGGGGQIIEHEKTKGPHPISQEDFFRLTLISSISRYLRRHHGVSEKNASYMIAEKAIERAELLAIAYIK